MNQPVITGIDFVYVFAKNFPAVAAFYENVLGLPCTSRYERAPGAEFDAGNLTLVVVDCEAVRIEFAPNTHPIALHVEDAVGSRDRLERHGVAFKHTLDSGVCHMAFFDDPDGNALMLHQRYAPEEESRDQIVREDRIEDRGDRWIELPKPGARRTGPR